MGCACASGGAEERIDLLDDGTEMEWTYRDLYTLPDDTLLRGLFDSLDPFSQETEVTSSRSLSRESLVDRVRLIWLRHPLSNPVREVTRAIASWADVDGLSKENRANCLVNVLK